MAVANLSLVKALSFNMTADYSLDDRKQAEPRSDVLKKAIDFGGLDPSVHLNFLMRWKAAASDQSQKNV